MAREAHLAFELPSTVLTHELAVCRVSQLMQLQFVRPRKRLSAVGTRVRLRVEGTGMAPRGAVHVEHLVTPRTRVHAGDRVGVAGRVRPQHVDLVEALVTQSTQVVLATRVHFAMTRQRRVVDETTVTHLHRSTKHTTNVIANGKYSAHNRRSSLLL